MIFSKPREAEWLSWTFVGIWITVIFYTITRARELESFFKKMWGESSFTYMVVASALILMAFTISFFLRYKKYYKLVNYIVLFVVGGIYILRAFQLAKHSPGEALHFIEYGFLFVLLYRALVHRIQHVAVFIIALIATSIIGNLDEVIQWMTPERYFDWRDVGLNAFSGFMMMLLIAFGLKPNFLDKKLKDTPIFKFCCVAALHLTVSLACLYNTPAMVDRYTAWFPFLQQWSGSWGEMTEYGYLYEDEEIGVFKSRFSPEQLAEIDKKRGFEVAEIMHEKRWTQEYGDFLREYSPATDPYVHEIRVHVHSRDHYLQQRVTKRKEGDVKEFKRYTLVGYSEERILRKYFPTFMKHYYLQKISPEWMNDMSKELPEDRSYRSRVSQSLVTSYNLRQVTAGYFVLMALVVVFYFWFKGKFLVESNS